MQKTKPTCTDPRMANGSSRTVYDAGSGYFCAVIFNIITWGIYWVILRQYIAYRNLEDIFAIGLFLSFSMLSVKPLTVCHKELKIAKELSRDGVITQAFLVDKWVEEEKEDGAIYQYYFIGYHFSYMNCTWVSKKLVKPAAYKIMQIGQDLPIHFLPRDPEISKLGALELFLGFY